MQRVHHSLAQVAWAAQAAVQGKQVLAAVFSFSKPRLVLHHCDKDQHHLPGIPLLQVWTWLLYCLLDAAGGHDEKSAW